MQTQSIDRILSNPISKSFTSHLGGRICVHGGVWLAEAAGVPPLSVVKLVGRLQQVVV